MARCSAPADRRLRVERALEPYADGARAILVLTVHDELVVECEEALADEIAPLDGLMLAFKRSSKSFHGHLPHAGHRRMVQIHWVDPKRIERNEAKRRTLRWRLKKLLRLG